MTKSTMSATEKKSAKAAYDKARRANKAVGRGPNGCKVLKSKAEVAADRAAVIAERAEAVKTVKPELKTTAGKNGHPPVKAIQEPKERKRTVASVAREMVISGSTDEAIFAQLVTEFKVSEEKKYYPLWYRSQLVRQGKITKAFADEHRHTK